MVYTSNYDTKHIQRDLDFVFLSLFSPSLPEVAIFFKKLLVYPFIVSLWQYIQICAYVCASICIENSYLSTQDTLKLFCLPVFIFLKTPNSFSYQKQIHETSLVNIFPITLQISAWVLSLHSYPLFGILCSASCLGCFNSEIKQTLVLCLE